MRRIVIQGDKKANKFSDNKIRTTKYTWYNFICKNLMIQFSKAPNVYFLIITFMQMIEEISISGGKPAMAVPLVFIVLLSMMKDLFEDYKKG